MQAVSASGTVSGLASSPMTFEIDMATLEALKGSAPPITVIESKGEAVTVQNINQVNSKQGRWLCFC
jgi:hypothetical protein